MRDVNVNERTRWYQKYFRLIRLETAISSQVATLLMLGLQMLHFGLLGKNWADGPVSSPSHEHWQLKQAVNIRNFTQFQNFL